jgi:hypothetical protein
MLVHAWTSGRSSSVFESRLLGLDRKRKAMKTVTRQERKIELAALSINRSHLEAAFRVATSRPVPEGASNWDLIFDILAAEFPRPKPPRPYVKELEAG